MYHTRCAVRGKTKQLLLQQWRCRSETNTTTVVYNHRLSSFATPRMMAKSFGCLPVEMILEIFSYLEIGDLLNSVQFVCSRWGSIAHHPRLWKRLEYRPDASEKDTNIIAVLQKAPILQSVLFDKVQVGPKVLEKLIKHCDNLKKLDLSKNELRVPFLNDLLLKCPEMEHLVFKSECLASEEAANIIGQFHHLETLIVTDADDITVYLKPIAEKCPELQHLDIQGASYLMSDMKYLLHKKKSKLHTLGVTYVSEDEECINLEECKTLQTLTIDCTCPLEVKPGLQSLGSLKSLTCLTLSSLKCADIETVKNLFGQRNLAQLKELTIEGYDSYQDEVANIIVNNCPELTKLHMMSCCYLTDESVKDFDKLPKLNSVDFYDSLITDIGVKYLTKCSLLKYLGLGCCRYLEEDGMKLLVKFKDLQELVIDGCDIKGLAFELIPIHLRHLRYLRVTYDYKYQDNFNQLQKMMPYLNIKYPVSLRAYLYRNLKNHL